MERFSSESSNLAAPATLLSIRLFGRVEVESYGRHVVLPSRRAGWLLGLLALRAGSPLERSRLAGEIWPESTDGQALHNLRQTLAALRRSLGPAGKLVGTISPRSLVLTVSSSIVVDVLEFDACVSSGTRTALQRAVELFESPLLPGCEEPFAQEERARREIAFVDVVESLVLQLVMPSEKAQARELLRRALLVDPYREAVVRDMMRLVAEAGERAAALEAYRELRARLRSDLGTEPDAETRRLYQVLRSKGEVIGATRPPRAAWDSKLPAALNSFVGRGSELLDVRSLVQRCRLVTLTGVGGVGKTRLAIAAARDLADDFADGARFIDFASTREGVAVPAAIAAALDVHEEAGRPILATLTAALRGRELLAVFDNCEHLTDAIGATLESLLSDLPAFRVLATSRQPLAVAGEIVCPVSCLPVPAPAARDEPTAPAMDPDELARVDSVRLFLDRGSGGAGSPPSGEELEAVAAICRRLEGIPLAIELAAARTKVLSVHEIERRLGDRFALLAGGPRKNPRHQTLYSAIEWSWDHLGDPERALLARMSVFRGGCDIEAIEAIGTQGASALDFVDGLVQRSLVNADRRPLGTRYTILESIREFAYEQLVRSGDLEGALLAHRDYFMALAETERARQRGPEQTLSFRRIESDHDNFRAVLDRCHARDEVAEGLILAVALARFWDTSGHVREGRDRVESAIELAENRVPGSLLAEARGNAGWLATLQQDSSAAIAHYERALTFFRGAGAQLHVASTLNMLASAVSCGGDHSAAMAIYDESLTEFRKLGEANGVIMVLNNMAQVSISRGDVELAARFIEECVAESARLDEVVPERSGLTHLNLALIQLRQGRLDVAQDNIGKAIQFFRLGDALVSLPGALEHAAVIAALREEWCKAARLLGASQELAATYTIPLSDHLVEDREAGILRTATALGAETYAALFEEGREMDAMAAVSCALSPPPSSPGFGIRGLTG